MDIRVESIERRIAGDRDVWVATGDLPISLPGLARIRVSIELSDDVAASAKCRFLTGQAPHMTLVNPDKQLAHSHEAVTPDQIVGIEFILSPVGN